ncbi:MAG: hypothetical protein BWK80_23330 [Desulfobacteraceae bacterium IS3]|nr:MAG: hypothetical protein BWK80_23330 [Desulfobacteraceae bacterium IS3]
MQRIAENEFYSIKMDEKKNRMYLTMSGYWKKASDFPNFMEDMRKALKQISKGFTILVTIVNMKVPSDEIAELHTKAQIECVQAGLRKTAEIVPSAMLRLSTKRMSQQSGMTMKQFDNPQEAETWLDQQAK